MKSLSGSYGIVILPDEKTDKISIDLSSKLLGEESFYTLDKFRTIPHITLYHSNFLNIPFDIIYKTLKNIRELLIGDIFTLNKIEIFADKFLFWNVEHVSESLLNAHKLSLIFSEFLDKTVESKATSEEKLSLSEKESYNTINYGHPLVNELYKPHITLGFDHKLKKLLTKTEGFEHVMTVKNVELVEVGFPGKIEKIVKSF